MKKIVSALILLMTCIVGAAQALYCTCWGTIVMYDRYFTAEYTYMAGKGVNDCHKAAEALDIYEFGSAYIYEEGKLIDFIKWDDGFSKILQCNFI